MKKYIFFAAIVVFSTTTNAQRFIGDWYGKLDIGMQKLPIVFHVTQNTDGSYATTMDSPDQKAYGLKADTTIIYNDSIKITSAKNHIVYHAQLVGDTLLQGTFSQEIDFKLNLNHTKLTAIEKKRPQTPKPPFSYNVQDTIYFNADKSIQYGATITYPKNGKKTFPLLILITGSGQQDRDETLSDHKPFAIIADYLTKLGYAVMRVDDRGVGQTTGDVVHATSADFANDVLAGIAFAKTLPYINKKEIGLLGHSEGGLIAPMVAAQSKDVAFIVSLAGVGVKGIDLVEKQQTDMMAAEGIPQNDAQHLVGFSQKAITIFGTEKDSADAIKKTEVAFYEWKKTMPDSSLKTLKLNMDSAATIAFIRTMYNRTANPWTQFFIKSNAARYWSKVSVPVLAINGSKDIQVAAQENLQAIKKAATSNGNKKVTIIELPGLNHLFQTCNKCTLEEYDELEESFSPQALKTIGDWLLQNVQL